MLVEGGLYSDQKFKKIVAGVKQPVSSYISCVYRSRLLFCNYRNILYLVVTNTFYDAGNQTTIANATVRMD